MADSDRTADWEHRLQALEARVADLETHHSPASNATSPTPSAATEQEAGVVTLSGQVNLPTGERYEWTQAGYDADILRGDWPSLASSLSALAHPVRLMLLQRVLSGTRTVGELSDEEAMGTSGQLYHHLRQLVAAGWLQSTARGHYAVPAVRVIPLLAIIEAIRRPLPGS